MLQVTPSNPKVDKTGNVCFVYFVTVQLYKKLDETRHCERSEAISKREIASSLSLLAMTVLLVTLNCYSTFLNEKRF